MAEPTLVVEDLRTWFDTRAGTVKAVDGVSFSVAPGRVMGLVGESGSGKSVTGFSIMGLIDPPGRIVSGRILFGGRDLASLPDAEMRHVRGRRIAMIFQDPMMTLNPVLRIDTQMIEAIQAHEDVGRAEARRRARDALGQVGIPSPDERLAAYPHQFSGGMRQRVMISMALACQPTLLLADEPTTALDVTIQAQILELLRDLQRTRGMGIMLITHNLGVVAENADVVCVMYAGRVVEYARVFELFDNPLHPYTRGLFNSIPLLRERKHRLTTVEEVVHDPAQFRLPGTEGDLVPWWPDAPKGVRPTIAAGRDDYALVQVAPTRWVGCFNSPWVESHSSPRPDLDYRREDA